MAHNRYFIIESSDPNKEAILKLSVGDPCSQKYSLDGSLIIIKLYEDDHEEHPELSAYEELNHEQMRLELLKPAWYNPDE